MIYLGFGLDLLSSISEREKIIPPNQITCSLCYNISFEGKTCNNRKCQKVFCGECIQKQNKKFYDKDKKDFKCPFCQTFSGFSQLEQDIIDYIKNFKYYCNKSKNCKEEYTYEQLINEHNHNNNINYMNNQILNKEKCYVCKKLIFETDLNTLKCVLCNNIGCYKIISYNALEKNNDIKNLESLNNEFCIQRCFICKLPICKHCSKQNNYDKNNISNFICDECSQISKCQTCYDNFAKNICVFCNNYLCDSCTNKCEYCRYSYCKKKDCLSKNISCQNCKDLNSKLNYYGCFHLDILNCSKCFIKCNLCKKNHFDEICNSCYNQICTKNCCFKCKYCSLIYCNKCSLMCSICKKLTCSNCANFCEECDKYNTLICCKSCKSNTIKKCQYQKDGIFCYKKLCISCWNACNFCGKIYCSKHCNNCSNCEDIICDKHYINCQKCLNKDELTYIKLCFKKCVLKCSFCPNISTVLCKEKNHKTDLVHNFGCKHNICNSCIKKCENCGKIVKKCLECIDYFYEFCIYCQKYQCLSCCNKCNKCDESYCSLNHICSLCNNIFPGKCFNCDLNHRNKCFVCNEKLKICELCKKKYICNFECYKKDKKKSIETKEHLCQMFLCKEHFNEFDK